MSEQCPLDTDGDGNCPKHPLGCVCSGYGSGLSTCLRRLAKKLEALLAEVRGLEEHHA